MLPMQDINPTRRFPIVNYILIGINVVVFLWEMSLGDRGLQQAFQELAVVPQFFVELDRPRHIHE